MGMKTWVCGPQPGRGIRSRRGLSLRPGEPPHRETPTGRVCVRRAGGPEPSG